MNFCKTATNVNKAAMPFTQAFRHKEFISISNVKDFNFKEY